MQCQDILLVPTIRMTNLGSCNICSDTECILVRMLRKQPPGVELIYQAAGNKMVSSTIGQSWESKKKST